MCDYLSMLGLKLIHVSKRGHRDTAVSFLQNAQNKFPASIPIGVILFRFNILFIFFNDTNIVLVNSETPYKQPLII